MSAAEIIGHEQFFAPMASDFVDVLVSNYNKERGSIENLALVMANTENLGAMNYFLKGNRDCFTHSTSYVVEKMFRSSGAIAALNSSYWQRALSLTDVYDYMPQARRDEWSTSIEKMVTPDFTDSTVRSTLDSLLNMRSKFLAERVDGIFRNLSGEHVTNQPQGFSTRMIIAGVTDNFTFSSSSRCGYITDLRAVIAKFMGRDEPKNNSSQMVVQAARRNSGQWVSIDGGALRIRVYLKGTAHLEVHPDMAWRLNMILASLYPSAIPASFRTRPAKKEKDFILYGRPLPFAVLDMLGSMEQAHELIGGDARHGKYRPIPNAIKGRYWSGSNSAKDEVYRVLETIGGVSVGGHWQFDYDPSAVLDEIVCSGCIPDEKAHQFYPTRPRLASIAIDLADISDDDMVFEPSAGAGGLVDLMPNKHNVVCVEVSKLYTSILESKGYFVHNEDFLKFHTSCLFDRVVMNPPFSEGRWHAHLDRASGFVCAGGRLVAILPSSAKDKDLLKGFDCEWHGPFDNEFAGTSVSVVILVANKKVIL